MSESDVSHPSSELLAEIHARITDAIIALDEEWRFVHCNETAQAVLDHSESDLLGEVIWDVFPEAVDSTFQQQYEHAMETGEPVTFEEFYPPLEVWLEVSVYPGETGLTVVFQDITDRVEEQSELELREETLRRAYDIIADRDRSFEEQIDGLLAVVRDAIGTDYATLSQVSDEEYLFEAVDTPHDDVQPGDTVALETTNCERVVSTEQTLVLGDVQQDAPELAPRAGNAEWGISCYLGAPVSVDGDVYGTFCFYDKQARTEDFSDWQVTLVDLMSQWVSYELTRQQTHDRLERERDRLELLASTISHDLRNPLRSASSQLAMAKHECESDLLDQIETAHDRLAELIDDLLDLAKQGETVTETERIDLASLAQTAWDGIETAGGSLSVEPVTVAGDPSRVRQIFENLFVNALEHGDGDTTVRVGPTQRGFFIEDDGPGVPPDERDHVFEYGYTTTETGTGFGLAIVNEIVGAHGWDLRLAESDDGGARFEISI